MKRTRVSGSVAASTVIRNCSCPDRCPADWDGLVTTADERVRYCSVCDRGVHLCETEAELGAALASDHTVAMRVGGEAGEARGQDDDLWEMDDTYFDQ